MTPLRGLTWDHPRGYVVLDALAEHDARTDSVAADLGIARLPAPVVWSRQQLADFEHRPLRTLVESFDLLVIDHPGLGEAVADNALTPLEELFTPSELRAVRGATVGASYDSYHLDRHQWALPLDAAAQVSVLGPATAAPAPTNWADALDLARDARTALCLGGPHALLMFAAICVSHHEPMADGNRFADRAVALDALDTLRSLAAHSDRAISALDPIGVLTAMTEHRIDYCPLVYGYISYAPALTFADAPGGGSVLGGTGIAVSAYATEHDHIRAHLLRLLSDQVQLGLYGALSGQSSLAAAWTSDRCTPDTTGTGFYASTVRTMRRAWVRPRHAGWLSFQRQAAEVIRDHLNDRPPAAATLETLEGLYRASTEEVC